MADKLTRQQQEDSARLERAVRDIRKSADLRFLFRQLFHLLGAEDGIPVENTNIAMALIGRQQASADIRAILMSYDTTLYAELLLEDANAYNNLKDEDDENEPDEFND